MDPYSFLNTAHTAYFAELYDQYLINPESVEPTWRAFFQGFEFGIDKVSKKEDEIPENILKEFKVVKLINAYRTRGHLFTKTNPVRERRKYVPNLDLENFELSENDLELKFNAGEIIGIGNASLTDILIHLERIYCDSIGIEYMYIRTPERIKWIQSKLNQNDNRSKFSKKQKKHILKKLVQATNFEQFLQKKFVGQKRFSLEGGESLIPALDSIFENAALMGVKEFVVGMAHRGRLNTLSNIFGKPAKEIFNEFDGKDYEEQIFDGDVKYHLGWTSKRKSDSGINIYMNLAPNPSHLESVGPVVEGISRAKQDKYHKNTPKNVLPVIIHGDAALSAQGVVYEVIQMERLKGYKTSGTIHIVVNNQLVSLQTTVDGRSSTYCTDVGKANLCPILHVNADDVEAVVHAANFALEYRMKYERDVFIDLLGYRKYGHNEGDEPRFTQPKLYKSISKHPSVKDIYSNQLINENIIEINHIKKIENDYSNDLNDDLSDSKKEKNVVITPFMQHEWSGLSRAKSKEMLNVFPTTVNKKNLEKVAKCIFQLDDSKLYLKKVARLMNDRNSMFFILIKSTGLWPNY
jgi:2-oxoglutarate dehydrogenase E1 component